MVRASVRKRISSSRSGSTECPRSRTSASPAPDRVTDSDTDRLEPRLRPTFQNWTPDGGKVAFPRAWKPEEGPHELMNADGSAKRRITATRAYETNPVFSPDGTRITFYERP